MIIHDYRWLIMISHDYFCYYLWLFMIIDYYSWLFMIIHDHHVHLFFKRSEIQMSRMQKLTSRPEVHLVAMAAAETWKSLCDFGSTAQILGRRCSTFSPAESGIRSYFCFKIETPQTDRKMNYYFGRILLVYLLGDYDIGISWLHNQLLIVLLNIPRIQWDIFGVQCWMGACWD